MLHERPKMTNSNPFSDPNLPSLEWLRDTIAARYDIPHQRRMDMVLSVIKTFGTYDPVSYGRTWLI